jgi:hypothetical protein
MKELSTRRLPRASNVVRKAVASGSTPAEMIGHLHGIVRPDSTAVVGQLVGVRPPRAIAPDAIGVTGFAPDGEIFPLAEIWREVTGEAMPPHQPPLAQDKPVRRRRKGAAP